MDALESPAQGCQGKGFGKAREPQSDTRPFKDPVTHTEWDSIRLWLKAEAGSEVGGAAGMQGRAFPPPAQLATSGQGLHCLQPAWGGPFLLPLLGALGLVSAVICNAELLSLKPGCSGLVSLCLTPCCPSSSPRAPGASLGSCLWNWHQVCPQENLWPAAFEQG